MCYRRPKTKARCLSRLLEREAEFGFSRRSNTKACGRVKTRIVFGEIMKRKGRFSLFFRYTLTALSGAVSASCTASSAVGSSGMLFAGREQAHSTSSAACRILRKPVSCSFLHVLSFGNIIQNSPKPVQMSGSHKRSFPAPFLYPMPEHG